MVSRRNFVTILLMMFILTFMFMFTSAVRQALNEYDVNSFEETTKTELDSRSMFHTETASDNGFDIPRRYVLFVEPHFIPDLRDVITYWCTYTKRGMIECESLDDYEIPEENLPEVAIIDGRYIDVSRDLPVMKELTERGVHLIFARMPHITIMTSSPELREFLGIRSVRNREILVQGVHLFDGFLLGGERIYEAEGEDVTVQELEMVVHWYMLDNGTKTYIMGMLNEDEYKNENMPAVIWRKSAGSAYVFCVNGTYITHMYGIGFLDAMMAEADTYEIYPVVNAQCMTVTDFPAFSEDNSEELMALYSMKQPALYEGVILPSLISIAEKTGGHMSLLVAPQLDYDDDNEPDSSLLPQYMRLVKEEYGEIGASTGRISNIPLEEKMSVDAAFYTEGAGDYAILSMYAENLKEIMEASWKKYFPKLRTIATAPNTEQPVIDYLDRDLTLQRATAIGREHNFGVNLTIMGYETGLGYSNIILDMKDVSYPNGKEDRWENLSREISENLTTYWQDFDAFSQTSLAESDARIRRFLALDYRTERKGDQIFLYTNEFEDSVWFLFKLNSGYPGDIQGGTLEDLGGGYYLLEAVETEIVINVENTSTSFY